MHHRLFRTYGGKCWRSQYCNFYFVFPGTSPENVRQIGGIRFLKNEKYNVVSNYKLGDDGHDNEKAINQIVIDTYQEVKET